MLPVGTLFQPSRHSGGAPMPAVIFEDFFVDPTDHGWNYVQASGTPALQRLNVANGGNGGKIKFNLSVAGDEASLNLNALQFGLRLGRPWIFETRMATSQPQDASELTWFVGLSAIGTGAHTSSGPPTLGFWSESVSSGETKAFAGGDAIGVKFGGKVDDVPENNAFDIRRSRFTIVADRYYTYRMEYDGRKKVSFWIDGQLLGQKGMHPDPGVVPAWFSDDSGDGMTPELTGENVGSTNEYLLFDYLFIAIERSVVAG